MAAKSVASSGDVTAKAGTSMYSGATTGTWTAGAISETTASLASSDAKSVVTAASCTFSFTGSNGQTAVTGTSDVKVEPGPRLITFGGKAPLVDGDSKKDSYGNELKVISSALLRTA